MKSENFDELIASIKEAGKIKRGEVQASRIHEFSELNIKLIRETIGFSQSKFAALIGVNIRTLQNWEQGRRHPTGPAKILLKLVQTAPELVIQNLHSNYA
jgi:putative transcriptional regulator